MSNLTENIEKVSDLWHVVDPYNKYVIQKMDQARKVSTYQGKPEHLQEEMKSFAEIYNLNRNTQTQIIKRCVEILHSRYGIDATHGLKFIKDQWNVECRGEPALRALEQMYNNVSRIMLVAKLNNAVNEVATCDDFRRYMTLTDILIRAAESETPNGNEFLNRLNLALSRMESMDAAPGASPAAKSPAGPEHEASAASKPTEQPV